MSNTDAVNVKDFDNLDKNKQGRALKQLEKARNLLIQQVTATDI